MRVHRSLNNTLPIIKTGNFQKASAKPVLSLRFLPKNYPLRIGYLLEKIAIMKMETKDSVGEGRRSNLFGAPFVHELSDCQCAMLGDAG